MNDAKFRSQIWRMGGACKVVRWIFASAAILLFGLLALRIDTPINPAWQLHGRNVEIRDPQGRVLTGIFDGIPLPATARKWNSAQSILGCRPKQAKGWISAITPDETNLRCGYPGVFAGYLRGRYVRAEFVHSIARRKHRGRISRPVEFGEVEQRPPPFHFNPRPFRPGESQSDCLEPGPRRHR